MNTFAQDCKIATILRSVRQGLSPDETADIFYKYAEIIHDYCDNIVQEKTASWGSAATNAAMLPARYALPTALAMIGLPMGLAAIGGTTAGTVAAKTLTPRNELPISQYQNVDETLRLKAETADILSRVAERKEQRAKEEKNRSVRALY